MRSNIFNTIIKRIRPKQTDSYVPFPVKDYPDLEDVTSELIDTAQMAFYLNLSPRVAAQWEMSQGPIRPTTEKIGKDIWIRWRVSDVRQIAAER